MNKVEKVDEMLLSGITDVAAIRNEVGVVTQTVYNRRRRLRKMRLLPTRLSANKKLELIATNTAALQRKEAYDIDLEYTVKPELAKINRIGRQKLCEAYRMMNEDKLDLDIAIALGLTYDEVTQIRIDYLKMTNKPHLASIYYDLEGACADLETKRRNLDAESYIKESQNKLLSAENMALSKSNETLKNERNQELDQYAKKLDAIKKEIERAGDTLKNAMDRIADLINSKDYEQVNFRVRDIVSKTLHPDLSFWIVPFWSILMTLRENRESTEKLLLSDPESIREVLKSEQGDPVFGRLFDESMKKLLQFNEDMALRELVLVYPGFQQPEIANMMTFLQTRTGIPIEEVVRKGVEAQMQFLESRITFDKSDPHITLGHPSERLSNEP